MPDVLDKTIQPALRLASMFLGHSRPFFMKILRANEIQVRGVNVVVRDNLLKNRKLPQCLDPEWVPTFEDEKAYDQALGEITGDFRLYCGENSTSITNQRSMENVRLFVSTQLLDLQLLNP